MLVEKYVWNDDFASVFGDVIFSTEMENRMVNAVRLIDVDINEALHVFNDCMKQAAECIKKRVYIGGRVNEDDWYDKECRVSKKEVRKLLNRYRRTLTKQDREMYCRSRREYKHLLNRKKKQYNTNLLNVLMEKIDSQKDFWNTMHKVARKRKQPKK